MISNTSTQNDPSIAVVSYRSGKRRQQELDVKPEGNGPVTPAGNDLQKVAKPLNPSIYSQLTPTLHKFTLRDKVAVITGYDRLSHDHIT